MKTRHISVPGETKAGIKAASEDFWYVGIRHGALYAAVGDWASNLMGGRYKDPETAEGLGHGADTEYNGGVIGTQVARRV